MKKLLSIIITSILLLSGIIGYCEEVASVQIPPFLAALVTDDAINEFKNDPLFVDYSVEQDGSMTIIMNASARDAALEDLKTDLDLTITELLDGAEEVASFTRIEYNEDVSEINVYVDKSLYTEWDSFSTFNLAFQGYSYLLTAGIKHEEMVGTVNIIDASTNTIIDTTMYSEAVESLLTYGVLVESSTDTTSDEAISVTSVSELPEEMVTIPDICEFAFESVSISDRLAPASDGYS